MCRDCGCNTASVFRNERKQNVNLSVLGWHAQNDSIRKVRIEESIFLKNQQTATNNRARFRSLNNRVFNIMSSPGAGKTTLLSKILPAISIENSTRIVVLVGDQETSLDAERLKESGLQAIQINTHSACHLDASRVAEHLPQSLLKAVDWVVIENVGNLVCPAVFDLGEQTKVALLSVTEGEEKPLKYPVLFQDAHLIVVTKTDLIPHLDVDIDLLVSNLRQQNSSAPIVFCSARSGEGLETLKKSIIETPIEVNA